MTICVRCIVSGRVQGVWFRDSTRRRALELGITGSATNLPDGTVEVVACGSEESVSQLREWLAVGPELARVERVECQSVSVRGCNAFEIG